MLSVFHEPWWLDAAAPGGWDEVRVAENGRAVARLPFVRQRFHGLRLLLAPPMTTRLGPLTDPGEGRYETRLRRFDHLADELIDQLPRADLFRQTMHPDVVSWLPFHRRGFRVEPQLSYVIDGLADLDEVWNGISGRTRRVIKSAGRTLAIERDTTADRLAHMVRSTFGRQRLEVPYDPVVLERIVAACLARDRGTVLTAVDASGNVHASLFCAWDDQRAWYLGGGGDPRLRSSGAGSLLMWELIKESAKHVDRFDFEGSMLPAVERYFRNFGGRQQTYFAVTRTSRRFAPLWALRQQQERAAAGGGGEDGDPTGARRLLVRAAGAIRRSGGKG
ncbi:GNAT family N-acetyltransferase [Pseudonocardia sp. H11422]|uniref:GNAT family N-acetyltransferase n=1 Tax=Pseudonocardia sp. H11422 TaxID=2835866 RepID=UPI0020292916|nr:GNAT family N-acetyltransferase [Pseudonocardia sp. H11422]